MVSFKLCRQQIRSTLRLATVGTLQISLILKLTVYPPVVSLMKMTPLVLSVHLTLSKHHLCKRAAAIWILKIQEVCKLPQSTTSKIMEDVGSLYESALTNIHAHVSKVLIDSGINPERLPDLSTIFSPNGVHGNLFKGLETHARQLQYYKSHLQFVVGYFVS